MTADLFRQQRKSKAADDEEQDGDEVMNMALVLERHVLSPLSQCATEGGRTPGSQAFVSQGRKEDLVQRRE